MLPQTKSYYFGAQAEILSKVNVVRDALRKGEEEVLLWHVCGCLLGFFSPHRVIEQYQFMLLNTLIKILKTESSVKLGFCVFIPVSREKDTNSQYKKIKILWSSKEACLHFFFLF